MLSLLFLNRLILTYRVLKLTITQFKNFSILLYVKGFLKVGAERKIPLLMYIRGI